MTLTRAQVRELCISLGYDPNTVTQIVINPGSAEVTVQVLIQEEARS